MWLLGGHRPPVFRRSLLWNNPIFETWEACRWRAWFLTHWANSSAWATAEDRVIDIDQFGNTSSSIATGTNWEMSFARIWRSAFWRSIASVGISKRRVKGGASIWCGV